LPPTANLATGDPDCDLDYVPHTARSGTIEAALCNCLGFGSRNAAIVVRRVSP
jgi:3-oxoacyl-[acyl-carrier-protein] synthase II